MPLDWYIGTAVSEEFAASICRGIQLLGLSRYSKAMWTGIHSISHSYATSDKTNPKVIKVKLFGNEVSVSVVQWGESLGKQGVLCIIISRRYIHHIRIIVYMDIPFIILLYTLYFFVRIVFSVLLC
jgi:hypothetical protein